MLRALCIGIDAYPTPINRLSCCVADATAIGSLLLDTHGAGVTLLTNASATLDGIRGELGALAACDEDDLVVVSFSGHGTPDHALVPVDADVFDLAASCMPLDELAHHLDRIPSKNLVVILDCCFSGGFGGARVFAPTAKRQVAEDRTTLQTMVRGEGRVVLTASGASEPALETAAFGHGLLSYHLIEGLQGVEGLASDGLIDLMGLLRWTVAKVIESAKLINEVQTPTIYGSFEGSPAVEALRPGTAYAAAFPERVTAPVTAEWQTLKPYGLSEQLIDAWTTSMPAGLNELQQAAINDFGVLSGKSVFVVAPTGSGKTLIGEIAAIQQALTGGRSVMLLPLRALVNDKFAYFERVYGDRLRVIRASGEYSDQTADLYSGHYDIALLTYEKFLNIAVGTPYVMRSVSSVVIDEVQNISDPNRGASLEFLITLLRSGHARGSAVQVIALSAVVGDTNGFEQWLNAGLLKTGHRPVPLRESVLNGHGNAAHHHPDGTTSEERFVEPAFVPGGGGSKQIVIPLVKRLVDEGKKAIVFRATKGETEGTAVYLGRYLGLASADSALGALPAGDLSASSRALRQSLAQGVGFHNSDLDRDERAALERAFRDKDSDLRVLVSTTTLAMGVNTPAEAVVIAGLQHPQSNPYSVAEYKNMAGRAGRPGFADAGESYIVATSRPSPTEAWHQYVLGTPEPIKSHFLGANTDPQTIIVRALTALGRSVEERELVDLLENSYAVWHLKHVGQTDGWDTNQLRRDLQALINAGLIDREPTGAITLTALGQFAGESGLEVRSVERVSSALRFIGERIDLSDLILLSQVTVELDDVYVPRNKRSHQEMQRWPNTLLQLGCSVNLVRNLHIGGGDSTARAKRAVAALRFTSSMPLQGIEGELTQHMRESSIAGPIRAAAQRTRDVIASVSQIATLQGHQLSDEDIADVAVVLLETGAPRELAGLAIKAGSRLTRADYLELLGAGVRNPSDFLAMPELEMQELLGEELTAEMRDILLSGD
ncbi:DEAD/DEAH box helicase [Ornithinimicrobium cerasi]|uniref:DEAD/DEAH box helicase n=1 Tax=Ornithinimicrobium cerasi TaxID=2248773 RepID=UPI000EFF3A1E|nr:DEAD/DEAH box helicase [Ornithinimicrobium cerasi]